MHWADVLASRLLAKGKRHVFATAITPSGPIHVGNMREVLTSELVQRATKEKGAECEFIYIADSYDPLRKVYPFLDETVYSQYVGRPLAEIPCPCGKHLDYGHHFIEPFFRSLDALGVKPTHLDAYTMYKEGAYGDAILTALDHTEEIREIIERVSGRKLPEGWLPFNAQCAQCRKLSGTRPTMYSRPFIEYACACGHEGRLDVTKPGAGKLPWRVDWPARWSFLGVTFEAFGKDHAAAGSSWDTGTEIAEKVFHYPPPEHTVYEFIQRKGKGAMHSSTGTAFAAEDMLRITPPEVLRFLIAHNPPNKHIDFDPGLGILTLVDEFDEAERLNYGLAEKKTGMEDLDRAYRLSMPRGPPAKIPAQVAYKHLVTVVQIAREGDIFEVLRRSAAIPDTLTPVEKERIATRAELVRNWLRLHAPDEVRFELQPALSAVGLSDAERRGLSALARRLDAIEWKADRIHDAVYEAATEAGIKGNDLFAGLYQAFLGKTRGPRAGHFLASLKRDFVLGRLHEASGTVAKKAKSSR